jgi:uncharacterized protein YneR
VVFSQKKQNSIKILGTRDHFHISAVPLAQATTVSNVSLVSSVHVSDFKVVNESSLMIDNNSIQVQQLSCGIPTSISTLTPNFYSNDSFTFKVNNGTTVSNIAPVSINVTSAPPLAGLVGYWDFDEGAGRMVVDKTGNRNDGIPNSGVSWASGKFGSGVQFDDINDYVVVTNRSGFNFSTDFTVALWVNPTNWNVSESLFSNGLFRIYHRGDWDGDSVYFLIKINSTENPGDSAWDSWGGVKTSQPLSENNWHSLIGIKSGDNMAIYLDGLKSGEVDVLSGYSTDNSDPGDLFIGGDGRTNFNGVIDEVKIWNRALTENEVQKAYTYPPMLLPLGNITVNEKSSLRFTVIATDVNNSSLSYSVSNLPQEASFSPLPTQEIFSPYSSGQKFSWTPSSEQIGTHTLCFSVSNGPSNSSECITITVTKNCLLNTSESPSGFVCLGDGKYAENVTRLYGADAKPTSNPLGGGVGYRNIIDPESANFTVITRSELMNALQNAVSGQIIYVSDHATINMTGDQNIAIPAGVTLASGRGRNTSLGALIYSDALKTIPLFIAAGEGVRVTGLRLQGPDPERRTDQMIWLDAQDRYYDIQNSRGIQSSYSNLTVDNCELLGWSHAAIYLGKGSYDDHIHHNYIHHNQREGLGYGVVLLTGADALIEANIFDWNRHSIAGSKDSVSVASYEACYNLVLENANSHYFDMHGGNDVSDANIPAGGSVKIHHNTFMESSQSAVGIRGVPLEGVWVYKNWALYDPNKFTTQEIFTQVLGNLPGHTPYENMSVYDNWYGLNPPKILLKSSKIAIFRPASGYWYFDDNLEGTVDKSFRYGGSTDQIIAGDWNGDGQDGIAIFRPSTGFWYFDNNLDGTVDKSFRYGGSTDQIIAGDWNGDGQDGIAIFRPSTGYWYFDNNLDGIVDKSFRYGSSTDQIIAGDWDGHGLDGIAIFRPSTGYWYFDYNLDGIIDKSFRYGGGSDRIISGYWSGTSDGIAIFRPSTGYWYFDNNLDGIVDKSFRYGGSNDQIVKGDWQGTGQDGIAIFRPSTGYWYFDYNLDGIVDKSFRYGGSTDRITVGNWV